MFNTYTPIVINVKSTGEKIARVPIQRSGYQVVRYNGRYHTIRGGGRTPAYIIGRVDGDDSLGNA